MSMKKLAFSSGQSAPAAPAPTPAPAPIQVEQEEEDLPRTDEQINESRRVAEENRSILGDEDETGKKTLLGE